jgi:hypothetical protein
VVLVAHRLPAKVAGFVVDRTVAKARDRLPLRQGGRCRKGAARLPLESVTGGAHDFLAVLAQLWVLGMMREKGLRLQLSPYHL